MVTDNAEEVKPEVVLGIGLGDILSTAYAAMIKDFRTKEIRRQRDYQHAYDWWLTVTFAEVYHEEAELQVEESRKPCGTYPEDDLCGMVPERVTLCSVTTKDLGNELKERVTKGFVIFRQPEWDSRPAWRVKVTLVDTINCIGRRTRRIPMVEISPSRSYVLECDLDRLCELTQAEMNLS
jgi:hypothetical protein